MIATPAILGAVRFISTDPAEPGVLAFGQHAYGIIAIGQMATGVFALGQVARGVIAIGQLSIGLIAIGQAAFGLFAGIAMIGVFGRGFPLSLVPKLQRPRELPPTGDLERIRMGYGDGWIDAELGPSPSGVPVLIRAGSPMTDIKLTARLVARARAELRRYEAPKVIAHVRRAGDTLVCDRLLHVPVSLTATRNFRAWMVVRVIALVILAAAVWLAIWPPIAAMFR